jgi:hypothetical protein
MLTIEHIIAVYADSDMELSRFQAQEVLSRAYPLYGDETEEESLAKCLREDAFERGCLIKEARQMCWDALEN